MEEAVTEVYDTEDLLKIKDLHTFFYTEEGVVKAVDGVLFNIKKDQIVGLVGETGCGKSVTALSILQLIRPPGEIEGGQVLFTHKDKYNHEVETDLTQSSYGEIREFRGNNITMIFQDPLNSLNPVIKIGDQLAEVYLLHQKEFLEQELLDTIKERENFLTQLEILIEEKNAMKQEIAKLSQEVKILSKKGTLYPRTSRIR